MSSSSKSYLSEPLALTVSASPGDPLGRWSGGQFGADSDVIVGALGHDDDHDVAPCDRVHDLVRGMGGVDYDDLVVVIDHPHVVVDIPGATVKAERSRK